MTDPDILNEAAESLLSVLQIGAAYADWDPETYVTAAEPSYDCDAIYVWVDEIEPEIGQGGCVTASKVRFQFGFADCIGADIDEEEIITAAPQHHSHVWGIWVALVESCCATSGTLLGDHADSVRVGTFRLLDAQGGIAVWTGTVTGVLSPSAIT
jgi:hypothetical protein